MAPNNSFFYRFISLFSDVFNPLTAILLSYFIINLQEKTLAETFVGLLWPTIILVLPTLGWIFYNVKTGKYATKDVSDRKSRHSLYWFVDGAFAVYLLLAFTMGPRPDPQLLAVMMLFVAMQISNYWIKSSMHTAFNMLAAIILWNFLPMSGLIWFIITLLVGASRIFLKKHTWAEVLTGLCIATAVGIFYLKYLSLK